MTHRFVFLSIVLLLAACSTNPPQPASTPAPSVDAHAIETTVAARIFATLTASAPKQTFTPVMPNTTSLPSGATDTKIGNVGERMQYGGIALTVNTVSEWKGDQFNHPHLGNVFLLIDMTAENVALDRPVLFTPSNFHIRDAEGFQYESFPVNVTPELMGAIYRGNKTRGLVSFEVKSDANGLVLFYTDLSDPSLIGPRFSLDR